MTDAGLCRRHRFPPDAIAHAVWLYFRVPLSLRMVEDLLAETAQIKAAQVWRVCALRASPRLLFSAQGDRKAKDRMRSHPGF